MAMVILFVCLSATLVYCVEGLNKLSYSFLPHRRAIVLISDMLDHLTIKRPENDAVE